MVLELQNHQPQPLHVAGDYTAKGGGHNHSIVGLEGLQYLKIKEEESKRKERMSRRNGAKLELKLNLSPPRAEQARVVSPSRSLTVSPTISCVSSEQDEYPRSPEATSMMLVGCPRCLMYVMLAGEDPRCPKCKSSVLLDIIHHDTTTTTTTRKAKKI